MVIPALERVRQEDCQEFVSRLHSEMVTVSIKIKQKMSHIPRFYSYVARVSQTRGVPSEDTLNST